MRDPESGWIRLHTAEFFFLWSALELGELPAALDVPHLGRTPSARAALSATADRTLTARGLGTVAGPDRDLAALLRSVSSGQLVLDLHTEVSGQTYRAIGVAGRGGAVAVGVTGSEVWLGPTREANLVTTLLGALPEAPPAPGLTANVRASDFAAACAEAEREGQAGFIDVLRDVGVRPPEQAVLVRAVTRRVGGGRFGGSRRGRENRWARANGTISWVDTAEGRYAFRRDRDWLMVTPLDSARLRSLAQELSADLAG